MRLWFLIIFLVVTFSSRSQITEPEQDCRNAIPACQTTYTQSQSYSGIGAVDDLNGQSHCLQNDENNSVWYIFTITISGILEMQIIPTLNDDYDFAIYDITGLSCSDIGTGVATEVRCNYAFTSGPTGLLSGYWDTTASPGDSAFLRPLTVATGETYVLVVDNFSSSSFGYTLNFNPNGASTASIIDFTPPTIAIVDSLILNSSTIDVTFSEPVLCSSLAANGSDFTITGPSTVTVMNASSTDCISGSFTSQVTLILTAPITMGGTYNLNLQTGAVEDNCGNQTIQTSLPFFVQQAVATDYFDKPKNFGVYPNPASHEFFVDLKAIPDPVDIIVTDVIGKIILSKTNIQSEVEKISIDAPPGVYFVRLRSNGSESIQKLLIE